MTDPSLPPAKESPKLKEWLVAIVVGVVLTTIFWWELWQGGGIIGGDLYTYFMPQKQFLAERLQAGEFPLWNNRTSYGYPIVAESQTGGLYPPHYILYRLFDISTAYNINQLLHYVLTFLAAWLLARELKLKPFGAMFAAMIYTYGWFPSRLCLEWAIIGGCYLPLFLWLIERFLKTSHWRFLIAMSVFVGVQLLAGHYNLAFISYLTGVGYSAARLWFANSVKGSRKTKDGPIDLPAGDSGQAVFLCEHVSRHRVRAAGLIVVSIGLGFTLASVKLLPTWELKRISQRSDATIEGEFDPSYGHAPVKHLAQTTLAPWWYFQTPVDVLSGKQAIEAELGGVGSNQVEAHLYFGLVPLVILAVALGRASSRKATIDRASIVWMALGVGAIVYSTGCLMSVSQHLPGFNFFRGPGRFGIVAALCFSLVVGRGFSNWLSEYARSSSFFVAVVAVSLSVLDLWYTSRIVTYAEILPEAPVSFVEYSPIREILSRTPNARVFGPDQNKLNLLGVSSVPEYLGLGPAEYYDARFKPPEFKSLDSDLAQWAREHGVTHVLLLDPQQVATALHPSENAPTDFRLVFSNPDPFFVAASHHRGPVFLFEVVNSLGRVLVKNDRNPVAQHTTKITEYAANKVEIEVELEDQARVVLTDLMYPGWEVSIDGKTAEAVRYKDLFRSVNVPAGRHTVVWQYRPSVFRYGLYVSAASLLILMAIAHFRFWGGRKRKASEKTA